MGIIKYAHTDFLVNNNCNQGETVGLTNTRKCCVPSLQLIGQTAYTLQYKSLKALTVRNIAAT